MKKTMMIKKNHEFKRTFSKGKFYYGDYVHMYIYPNKFCYNRLGIAVSRKAGKAVKRNRVKRLIRENYKNYEEEIKIGYNILIILNKNRNIREMNFCNIEEDFYKIFKKANIFII